MRIAVTGAGGFLGAHVVRALLDDGVTVRAILRSEGAPAPALDGLPVEKAGADLGVVAELPADLFAGCDGVIHLAAAYAEGAGAEALLQAVNVDGTARVLRAAAVARVPRVVHCSSMGTCVTPGLQRPVTEADTIDPGHPGLSPYNRSKLLGELEALTTSDGPEVVVVNPSAPVGAWDLKPTVTGARIRDVVQGRWPRLVAGPVNHVSASACARGMVQAFRCGRPGERYLLGGEDVGPDAFVARVSQAAGRPAPRRSLVQRLRGKGRPSPGAFMVDATKARRELHWDAGDLDAAFGEAASWFASQP